MSGKEDVHKLVSTAGLLLIDAMVFHEIIASFHKNVPTLSMRDFLESEERAGKILAEYNSKHQL